LHVIDMAATDGRDPWEDYLQINRELALYNAHLTTRPQLIVANKMDLPDAQDQLELFREQLTEYTQAQMLAQDKADAPTAAAGAPTAATDGVVADGAVDAAKDGGEDARVHIAGLSSDVAGTAGADVVRDAQVSDIADGLILPEIFPISTVTHAGVQQLLYRVADLLEAMPTEIVLADVPEVAQRKIYTYKNQKEREEIEFVIRRENEDYVIESAAVDSYLKRVNLTSYDAVMRFARAMRSWGIDDALRAKGAKNGDTIWVGDFSFEFFEGSDYGDYV
jgi:Obg family GTPase CgtA-like protein